MTSDIETLKTNEFLRRRKLRLQQVREQSKDIAKKIRQRAKVETLRQVVDLDAKKQKEYFDRQEKLVKRLEVLYTRGLNNVGASHHSATELAQQEVASKTDLSKLRGKEAAAELRKKRQEKLDEQKKLLDRKLQARETANEISRDKSTVALNKLTKAAKVDDNIPKATSATELIKEIASDNDKVEPETVTKNDMGTQWDVESIPKEWEPAVPALKLPKDDQGSLKDDETTSKSDQSKRLDLFAVSKEMPTDLGARHVEVNERRDTVRPSLTLVSEYLQTRKLRLREPEPVNTGKKPDDISSLKQTILRTRINRAEGSSSDACHVLDEQVIPVPSWHAERKCECCTPCTPTVPRKKSSVHPKQFDTVTNSQINRIFSSIRPLNQSGLVHRPLLNRPGPINQSGLRSRSRLVSSLGVENQSIAGPSPILRSSSPFQRNRVCQRIIPSKAGTSTDNSRGDIIVNRKSSVTMYNHNTRDTRDLLCVEPLVVRDQHSEEDAYAQAMKEASVVQTKDKEHQKRVQDMRNKVAVTKQTVEKEYKDTMNFLNSLPKDKSNKVTKTAYMDDRRQQIHNENRQHKLQQEYRQIEKECRRHHSCTNKRHTKSKSPLKEDVNDNFDSRDFQYSWMPVPEGDGNLAIHAIPNTVKRGKLGNSVKFSQVDSYHEYRSRHKHTPPTKDTASHEKRSSKKRPDTIIIDENVSESTEDSTNSTTSDTSSVENLRLNKPKHKAKDDTEMDKNSSDAERIIIYKILDTKRDKKNKLLSEIAKSLTSIETKQKSTAEVHDESHKKHHKKKVKQDNGAVENSVPFENINEGIYKVPEENRDNMSNGIPMCIQEGQQCQCRTSHNDRRDQGTVPDWESTPTAQPTRTPTHSSSTSKDHNPSQPTENQRASTSATHPTATASNSSFLTATTTEKSRAPSDGGYIKLVDEAGQDTGKFFLGSTSFLKDAAYEVVIQLRKKGDSKEDRKSPHEDLTKKPDNVESKDHQNANVVDLVSSEPETNLQIPKDTENREVSSSEKATKSPRDTKQESIDSIAVSDSKDQNPTTTDTDDKKTPAKEKKDVSDKGTTTTDFSEPMARFDPPSRPATTTYTQTTNSPIHRPMYIHMSSSTSTAYMSPPDMIMPKFMRRNSAMTDYELREFKKTKMIHNPNVYDKNSKKCRHTKKTSNKENLNMESRKNVQNTPPNSARSSYYTSENFEIHKPSSNISRHEKIRCKCLNCASSPKDWPKTKKQCTKHKNIPPGRNRVLDNLNILTNRNITSKNKYVTSVHGRKNSGTNLNPVLKGYINKLLALNREGLKAIEVAEQECSSVETPGSSIINIPYNIDERKCMATKISLEQIKKSFLRQFIDDNLNYNNLSQSKIPSKISLPRQSHRKTVHKVKSLNISKRLLKNVKNEDSRPLKNRNHVSTSTTTDDNNRTFASSSDTRSRQRSSQSSRQSHSARPSSTFKDYNAEEIKETPRSRSEKTSLHNKKKVKSQPSSNHFKKDHITHKATVTDTSPETESTKEQHNYYKSKVDIPISMATQTQQKTDSDFMKLAEDKLHNMEKIADLTEKCTVRLSNLAKVLEEVRKKKSLTYSQISASDSTDSQPEQKSDNVLKSPVPIDVCVLPNTCEVTSGPISENKNTLTGKEKAPSGYISFLSNIPKPLVRQLSEPETSDSFSPNTINVTRPTAVSPVNVETNAPELTKPRQKPPPALSRIHLKHNQEFIVPHELSTVIEVDSPMSLKNKTPSSRNDVPNTSNRSSNEDKESGKTYKTNELDKDIETNVNPDLLQSNLELSKQPRLTSNATAEDSKFQMIDLKHFNEIMLEPFISIHEYAKKYNVETLDEGSNIEELQKNDPNNDDMSSLHSDGSLPDVIAELLKRNIIAEPFKFDTPSNVNSTTISSESTLSLLALSKARKGKKKPNVVFRNKENICETSDTMSISSNPDLENAFKKLGMGWASSTLKKTKERLALSSSSNTSSSSISQLKIKTFNQDIPALVTDSVSSVLLSKMDIKGKSENSKNAKQRTIFPHSMTVNEFLNNELADKITFTTNKSEINDTEDEFVSLFETKMPEGMNQQSEINRDEHSNDTMPSGVNRARTSTPVQIFKSVTYHSSSGSNISNGLFSNADDLSSVKMTSNSMKNNSTSERDELTIPNFSLKMKKSSECSKSD